MTDRFKTIVICDFEYEIADGGLPNVLCMVAYVLAAIGRHIRTIRLWRGEFGYAPPFDIGPDTLFVAYSAWAEMTCFLVLGWKFPVHIFDQHTAYIAASNILLPYEPDETRKRPRRRLSDACRMYGVQGWEGIDKEDISQAIGNGTWRGRYTEREVIGYNEADTSAETKLFRRQILGTEHFAPADVQLVLHWSNYSAKAIALIQARGIPIDTVLWNIVQENKAAVILALLRRFDPSRDPRRAMDANGYIFTAEGEFSYQRFEAYLAAVRAPAWPRLDSGQLDISSDAMRLMYSLKDPEGKSAGIEGIHALRDSIGFIAKARLPIGPDGRNRPSLFPFGTATGRNAHAKSPYNAHAGVRSFIRTPAGSIVFYLDFRSQEVGIAAADSEDQQLMDDYSLGDIYYSLANMCGYTNEPYTREWKKTNEATRARMKPLQLGINYGMGVRSLSRGLDRHPLIGAEILRLHQERYPRFWKWRSDVVQSAMLERRIESQFGWPLRITASPNKRTLYNFPAQAGGAEMTRLATVRLIGAGIVPIMLIHDGILFEESDPEKIKQAIEIMQGAGRDTCSGFKIGVALDKKFISGERYRDSRQEAVKMWATIVGVLREIGAISGNEEAA